MNRHHHIPSHRSGAFTLIELLVVIAVIGVLAALILPVAASLRNNATKGKVQAELQQIVTAIDAYKEKLGFYPPESAFSAATNVLYYELLGTTNFGRGAVTTFVTLNGSPPITSIQARQVFGNDGFVNCNRAGNADDAPVAKAFLSQLRPAQWAEIVQGATTFRLLTCSVRWKPDDSINPWHYRAASATNNPGGYDLWVNVLIGGRTNRFSNWSKQPQIVNTTD